MEKILSKDNNLIKETRKLKEKKYRIEKGLFLVEGFRFVEEAVKSSFIIKSIFIDEKALEKLSDYNIETERIHANIYIIPSQIFKTISTTETPQGIIAVVENKEFAVKNEKGFYIYADKVQDPGNMGTIIRTAHASGALGVIYSQGTVDIYNEKTLRSTMGSIFRIPVILDKDMNKLKELKAQGFKLIVSSLDTNKNFFDVDLSQMSIIAVGNEGNGVSDELYNLSDEKVKIPMPGGAESLNVAVAASIMAFEAVRQTFK
ncbi:TrmH family RNA methyltransferase [Clostridium cellulovorans]|uniref:tRNA/rRNA methyltransferase (SpoU) n=1 Tax=Clostridium cellulovorans (strain ATCC 35296 / DSM 3052 / OCM 3 / 743B) TaxID=573061 RepID=D9SM23_CLOC7|nr:RNA methyltransferase [Clostridium cellulovorans]ADL51754.1 tRNA/rRNA methyltransferase (SpoU) [Clostridium cellulovorans 743B]